MLSVVYIANNAFGSIVTFEDQDKARKVYNLLDSYYMYGPHKTPMFIASINTYSTVVCDDDNNIKLAMDCTRLILYIPVHQFIDILNIRFSGQFIIRTNISIDGYEQYALPNSIYSDCPLSVPLISKTSTNN